MQELKEKYKILRTGGQLDPDDPLQEFLTKNGVTIPNKYLCEHLRKIRDSWETGTIPATRRKSKITEGKVNTFQYQKEYDPDNMMAESLGMATAKLRQMISGENSTRFYVVDRIFQELGLTHLWYEDEALALAYGLVE
jgi:hypothetical protein